MQHLLKGMSAWWGRFPRGHSCLFFLEVIFRRRVSTTEQTWLHDEEGTTMRNEICFLFHMSFHSPEVLGFTTVQRGGSWQTTAYASEEAVVSWTLSKEQMGRKPAAAVLDQMMGASCTRHEIWLADVICQVQLFRGSQWENGRGVSSSVPAELIEQKKQSLLLPLLFAFVTEAHLLWSLKKGRPNLNSIFIFCTGLTLFVFLRPFCSKLFLLP